MTIRLTNAQKTILVRLTNLALGGQNWVKLVCANGVRETTTGCALVRKGLLNRRADGRFEVTADGLQAAMDAA